MENPWEVINESSASSDGWDVVAEEAPKQSGWEVISEEGNKQPVRIVAPIVNVPEKKLSAFDSKLEEIKPKLKSEASVTGTGILSGADIAFGLPGFMVQTIGTLGHAVTQQYLKKGAPNLAESRAFGEKLAQDLSLVPERGEVMPGEYLAKNLGLQKEYKESFPTRVMDSFGEAIDVTSEAIGKSGVMSKDAAKILIDTSMLLAPFAKGKKTVSPLPEMDSRAVVEEPLRPSGTTYRPVTTFPSKTGVLVPKVTADPKQFSNSLKNLQSLNQLDVSETVAQGKMLEDLGVTIDLQEKFRRFDEGQAKGNELIDNKIKEKQNAINDILVDNFNLFSEHNFTPRNIAENKASNWKDIPKEAQERIKENFKRRDEILLEIEDLVSKRGSKESLSPIEASIYSRFYLPLKSDITNISRDLMERGKVEPHKLSDDFAPRKVAPAKKTVWQTTKEALIGKDYETEQPGSATNYTTDAAKERGFYVLEDPVSKKRTTISISDPTPKGEVYINLHKNKFKTSSILAPESVVRDALENDSPLLGQALKEASKDEIELNIGPKYVSNYQAVLGVRRAQIRDQSRHADWVDSLINHKDIAVNLETLPKWKDIPEGFRTLKYTNKMPELRNYAFENRYAEMLDDYNKPTSTNPLIRATNTLVTNMMLIPMIHMHNEGGHWGISRGLSGFVNPVKFAGMLEDFPKAATEVLTRGPLYQAILREGGSIMSANVRNTSYFDKAFRQSSEVLLKTPQFKQIAAAVGRTPASLYAGISKFSNTSMWTVRDILYTQLIMEKMRREGSSVREAITQVERHMPSYRLPSRIGEKVLGAKISRGASVGLGNKNLFLFSRYHHGLVNSALNTIKDVAMLDKDIKKTTQFKEGVDSALAVWVALSVVYPLVLDQMASFVAGVLDDDGKIAEAKVRRPGFLHIFDGIKEVTESKKDAYSVASTLVTLNPILQMGIELAWNYELYNRKDIINWQDPSSTIFKDYAAYMARKVPQLAQGVQATNEDYGTGLAGVLLRNFFDIRTKTDEQISREKNVVKRKEKEAWNREFED